MTETAIYSAARLAAFNALPDVKDWSDDAADPEPGRLDALVVTLTRDKSESSAMGATTEDVQLTLQVELFSKYGAKEPGREIMRGKIETVRDAIKANAPLVGLVDYMICQSVDVDVGKADHRFSLGTLTFEIWATV